MPVDHIKSFTTNANPLDVYVSENSLREHPVLKELREHTINNVRGSIMLSDPVEVQLLQMLLKMLNAKKCLEVGTFTGYNVLSCALTIPDDGVVHALDINEDFVQNGYPFFEKANVRDKIKIKIGPAVESMDAMIRDGETETFDFVYIDADKFSYKDYVDRAYHLLRFGGLAVIDNTLWGGTVAKVSQEDADKKTSLQNEAEYLHKLNQELKKDKRFQLSFLNLADGVTLLRKLTEEERSKENI